MNINQELKKAMRHHQAGQLDRARDAYTGVLEINPLHPDAMHLLGLIAYQQGDNHTAINLIKQAIQIAPDDSDYYNNLANAYVQQGTLDEALACFEKVFKINPDHPEALFGMGNVYLTLERYDRAMNCYRRALDIKPDFYEACNNMGSALFEQGNYLEASYYYQKAIQLQPEYFEALINLGNAFNTQGRFDEAIDCYQKTIEIKPDCAESHANLGFTLQCLERLDDAINWYHKALQIKPDYSEVNNSLGTVYREMGQLEQALECFKKAATLKPQDPEAYNNMGIVYKEWGRFEEAISAYQKALQLKSDFTEAYCNLGNVYGKCGNLEGAIECYRNTIQLKPDHAYAYNRLIRQLQQACAWSELEDPIVQLNKLTKKNLKYGGKSAEMPFLTFSLSDDPAYNFMVAKSWADEIINKASKILKNYSNRCVFSFISRRKNKSRLTVGYLSADFQNHATAHLMLSLFGYHDRKAFEIIAYSYGKNDGSYYRRQIKHDCDKFVDLGPLNHFEAAKAIYKDEVDILVDLKGYTDGNRLEICAFQPAPIQVAYLGFPGTTGANFVDYIITDRIVSPPDQAPHFSEKFVYMPHTYQVNDCRQKISAKTAQRNEFGLPDQGTVFGSFNGSYKIEPVMFDVWMNVLRRAPNSVIWLLNKCRTAKENLKNEAEMRGVEPERLIFANKLPKDKHLARLKLVDLVLDTRMVNGHTTTSDALWAGAPVITLQGNHFASRVASSILTAAGLPELITYSLSDYEELAVQLVTNPELIKSLKEKIARHRLERPLFDTACFTRNLESAYKMMWQIYLNGEEPQQIDVLSDE